MSAGVPLWGEKILNSGEAIHEYFGRQIDLELDIGVLASEPSTVVDCTGQEFSIIRQGKGIIQV